MIHYCDLVMILHKVLLNLDKYKTPQLIVVIVGSFIEGSQDAARFQDSALFNHKSWNSSNHRAEQGLKIK